jgi:hypothetical protein
MLPPVLMAGYRRIPWLPQSPRARLAAELAVIYLSVQAALPAALAIYPQRYEVPVSKLEPQFRSLVDSSGRPIKVVYGNKGL